MSAPRVLPGDWSLAPLVLPTSEPVTLAQMKTYLKLPSIVTDEDDEIMDVVAAARGWIEKTYDIWIMPQQWELRLQYFPRADRIRIPKSPIRSVDYLRYTDTGYNDFSLQVGTGIGSQVLTRLAKNPAELILPFGAVWPPTILQLDDPVKIGLTGGFDVLGSPSLLPIPGQVIRAIKLLVDTWYNNRSSITLGSLQRSDPMAHGVEMLMASIGYGGGYN